MQPRSAPVAGEAWRENGAQAGGAADPACAVAAPPGAATGMAARLRLPNGMVVVPQSRAEAEHFYDDLFAKRIYLRHGVTLQPGDCVFDVGGNIGMFTLFAHRAAPGARIFTFEPAPPLLERIRANLALNGAAARVFPFGIADAERTARFTFYPNSPGMSSFYADAEEERQVLRRMIDLERGEGHPGMDVLAEFTDELLDERFRPVEMECRLRPLSAVIREEGVGRIDLLKIDVQKAELDVLRGIDDEHWPLIRQIVIEVHDLDGRLDEVTRLLESRGFQVATEQDEAVEGTILYNLFAVSPTVPPRSADPLRPRAEEDAPAARVDGWSLLLLSASSPQALERAAAGVAGHLAAHPELPLPGVARALRARPALPHRRAVVAREGEDVSALLRAGDPVRVADGEAGANEPRPAFLFSGVGEQYPGMGRGLYDAEPVFRQELDRCAEILRGHLGFDLRDTLFATDAEAPLANGAGGADLRRMLGRAPVSPAAARLNRTEVAQPVAFAVGYALARLWESRGVRPAVVMGHSLGEYTAACVAGVFSLDDALELVALRARTIEALPGGAMLAVPLSAAAVRPLLGDEVALAAVNAPELCVLAGTDAAVTRVQQALATAGTAALRLAATHAFHSPLMHAASEQVAALVARKRLSAPRIPLISNVTGRRMTDAQAIDPRYWARHLTGTVRFAAGAAELLAEPGLVLVELGPGGSLSAFVRQQAAASEIAPPPGVTSLPHAADAVPEPACFLGALGRLWTVGVRLDGDDEEARGHAAPADLPEELFAGGDDEPSAAGVVPGPEVRGEDGLSDVEKALAAMWRELLRVEPRPDDDFFALGGQSLAAAQLVTRVRTMFGVEMRLRTLFRTRTLRATAAWIEETAASQAAAPAEPANG